MDYTDRIQRLRAQLAEVEAAYRSFPVGSLPFRRVGSVSMRKTIRYAEERDFDAVRKGLATIAADLSELESEIDLFVSSVEDGEGEE